MLMAGLDGIKNKIDLAAAAKLGYFSQALDAAEASIPSMPGSLDEALGALGKVTSSLTVGGVFPEDYIELWINYKKKNEADAVRMRPHPYEVPSLLRYLELSTWERETLAERLFPGRAYDNHYRGRMLS